jgi:exodeoxyribonuclease V beta subunit
LEEGNTQSFDDLLQRLDEALAGPGGASLARSIRERFPAALIDEFQDTDPTQYRIFRRAYHETGAKLFLIGDPKQAIYAFRGADVFTYIDAKHDAAQHTHTLETNWRSDPGLLRAVNTLFGRAELPFAFADIPFVTLESAPDAADALAHEGAPLAPFQILFFRGDPEDRGKGGKRINKGPGLPAVCLAIAREIARFLQSGATIDGRRVEPADIAVLCRTNDQARQVQEQLRLCRVPSALQGDASVFDSQEADELDRVLRPLAEPGDFSAFRAALSTSAIGLDAERIYALELDEHEWNEWAERFETWHGIWLRHGFMPAFRRLLDDCKVPAGLLALIDGERRLTNLLHLGELLHRAAVEQRLGPLALVEWLALMRRDVPARHGLGSEAAQIRLESDARAAKLTTIHKSKGLEYPIVYCPFMWDGKGLHEDDKIHVLFHDPDDGNRLKLDLGSVDIQGHVRLREREAFAENLRLLYVALTRAKHRCSVVWGAFNQFEGSALGYLLHQADRPAGKKDIVETTVAKMKLLDDAGILADLDRLARQAAGAVEVTELPTRSEASYADEERDGGALRHREALRRLEVTSRTSSFSRLVATGTVSQPAEEGADYDEVHVVEEVRAAETDAVALGEFPAGARPGQLLHGIFEHLDFTSADSPASHALLSRMLALYGVEESWAEPLHHAIVDVLETPLDEAPEPLRLRSVRLDRRLNELQFLFPVADSLSPATFRLTSGALADAFIRHAVSPMPEDYPPRIRQLGFTPLAGYLTGFIDMVFEHGGRWYLVDYKSNHLGSRADDYAAARLSEEMAAHHYFLQYHLYVVALHRYLTLRLPGYDYERHFGGVYYLFLRGMSARHLFRCGVFYDRPPRALVEALSDCMLRAGSGRT